MEIYLDNAATSHPKPESVRDAVNWALTDINANPGRSGHSRALAAAREVLATREAIAEMIGAPAPLRIIMTQNCTDSLNLAIKGIVQAGDHVISTYLEHNSVLRVLTELTRRKRITMTLVRPHADGEIAPADIRAAINPRTRLIVMTLASNVTGVIQPAAAVGAIARAHGIRYLIDGAQAIGSMPVDVSALGCDMLAFPGHKGLLGPCGTGALYLKEDVALAPLREGGTGSSSDSMLQPTEVPERYESGTLNLPGIAGLHAGVRYVQPRLREIMQQERQLSSALSEGLAAIDGVTPISPGTPETRIGVFSFNIGDLSSSQTVDQLNARGICVRGGLHCAPGVHQLAGTLRRGAVRVSIGHANTMEEIETFLRAVREIAG